MLLEVLVHSLYHIQLMQFRTGDLERLDLLERLPHLRVHQRPIQRRAQAEELALHHAVKERPQLVTDLHPDCQEVPARAIPDLDREDAAGLTVAVPVPLDLEQASSQAPMVPAQHEALDPPVPRLLYEMLDELRALESLAVSAYPPDLVPELPQGGLDRLDQRAAALHHVVQHLLRGEGKARIPEPSDLGHAVHVYAQLRLRPARAGAAGGHRRPLLLPRDQRADGLVAELLPVELGH